MSEMQLQLSHTQHQILGLQEFTNPLVFVPLRTLIDYFLLVQGFVPAVNGQRKDFIQRHKTELVQDAYSIDFHHVASSVVLVLTLRNRQHTKSSAEPCIMHHAL